MAERSRPRKGDRVAWKSHGSEAVGEVEEEITERTEAAGRTVDASPGEPQYQVRSEKSGRAAVHKPEALRPEGGGKPERDERPGRGGTSRRNKKKD
ncbi:MULTISPECIES: DUF2945 domain-containing protein [Streptomyces]|uniref:DUF2945 domain-containing protein n=2 Tax=Streptomyces TaxID=1883 RepID=A0ABQ7FFC2_9ACTN|nr:MULTISPECIES: DUF2945 domain-containing protein [Streptomyces]KAF4407520.1 DUF2945 domain-containing protein [Streptomyces lycii]PGH52231.1 hypothetical protein CRI70_02530 [Streptomyces sp. Ru87]